MTKTLKTDVIIIGAGAAGLMCAIEAGKRGRSVLVLDHANKVGKKILMSGGGRCNFTNYHIGFDNYLSNNPHFCKSALSRYTQWDFIELVNKHNIPFHEKTLGQLFCDNKSRDIVNMLVAECDEAGVSIKLNTTIHSIDALKPHHYKLHTTLGDVHCESLVIASGGLSIPTMGASPFGYQIAEQFGLKVLPTRAGLVPFTLHSHDKEKLDCLSGIGVASITSNDRASFSENMLFTHRGLSGPAMLQISSYWQPGEAINVNLMPSIDLYDYLQAQQQQQPQQQLKTSLSQLLPKRVVNVLLDDAYASRTLANLSDNDMQHISHEFQGWQVKPNGTEGYRTAEVTLGGVDCDQLSSKTFEVNNQPGLYFLGEVLDVTGWLGGYNFQWAWSSGWAGGQVV
tara:strand:+ start:1672 stop:2862 length:1191 start_codon:yes stop_codon:yes gene_type:complete